MAATRKKEYFRTHATQAPALRVLYFVFSWFTIKLKCQGIFHFQAVIPAKAGIQKCFAKKLDARLSRA
jgi:hypothetical protein